MHRFQKKTKNYASPHRSIQKAECLLVANCIQIRNKSVLPTYDPQLLGNH
jgi:hypothetical protein